MYNSDVLQLIQIQRSKVSNELIGPGWTSWALLGAFSTLAWGLISILGKNTINIDAALQIALMLVMLLPNIEFALGLGASIRVNPSSEPRYYSRLNKVALSPTSLYQFVVLGIVYISSKFFGYLPPLFSTVYEIAFYLMVATYVFLAILELTGFPISQNSKTTNSNSFKGIVYAITIAFNFFLAFGFFLSIRAYGKVSIHDIQIGLIIFGIHFIVKKFFDNQKYMPIIRAFDLLMDNVTFNKISNEEAMNQLRIIVHGLSFRDIIFPYHRDYIESCAKFENIGDTIQSMYSEILNIVKQSEKSPIEQTHIDTVDHYFSQINLYEKDLQELIKRIDNKKSNIKSKLSALAADNRNTKDFDFIITELLDAETRRHKKQQEIQEKVKELTEDVERLKKL